MLTCVVPSRGPGRTPPLRRNWTIYAGCRAHATGGAWPTPPGGELVGSSVPSRNYGDPLIGYLGVIPEHRGHGYAYDLLVEATHILAGEGVDRIVAGTDQTNYPVAATFAKAGYPIDQERIDLI